MNITFVKPVWDAEFKHSHRRHRVVQIGLSTGAHDIPNGFLLTAACSETEEVAQIDLDRVGEHYLENVVECATCFPKVVEV